MSDAIQPSLFHRIRHTPLRDIFRGRLNGRLDWRARLAAGELPVGARELVGRVVKRTRLWRIEKAALADELAAHFRDAVAAGQTIDNVIAEFGDERKAAKLVRRAKIRNRPLLWHGLRWARRGVLVLILAYVFSYPFYFFSRPSPRVDYLSQINAPIERVPAADRAWPVYRQTALALRAEAGPEARNSLRLVPDWLNGNVDGSHWPQIVSWLQKHRPEVEALRAAAAKPSMGFVLGPDGSHRDPDLFPSESARLQREWSDFPLILSVTLPQLSFAHSFAHILEDDAKLAQLDHDGPRLVADINSILGIADQIRRDGQFIVTDSVADSTDYVALNAVERVLQTTPSILSDAELIDLAHRFAGPLVGADITSLAGERMAFHDVVQHVYSDNGDGDGHLTSAGLQLLFQTYGETAQGAADSNRPINLSQAAGPANIVASVSRKELLEKFDRLMDLDQANLEVPLRHADWQRSEWMLQDLNGSTWALFRYGPVAAIIQDVRGRAMMAEVYLGRRDGVTTAIALELYRRHAGAYPQKLDQMVPRFMPNVPADRITGDPIKYKLIDGKPLLYSVGADFIDDGGTPASNGDPTLAAQWWMEPNQAPRGDWILYPPGTPND